MASKTSNFGLTKPALTEPADIQVINANMDIIDNNMKTLGGLLSDNAGSHNSFFRGKNLGNAVTSSQSSAIQNGSFSDIYVGDYWVINGTTYRVAGCNVFLHTGDSVDLGHNVVVVPDACILNGDGQTTHYWNDTDTTTGGYIGSKMYKDTIPNKVLPKISNDFGSHLYQHREYLSNSIDSTGFASGGVWCDSKVELMNEVMLYGSVINGKTTSNSAGLYNIGIGNTQLPLFRLAPHFIHPRQNYWLRDIASSAWVAYCNLAGNAVCNGASDPWLGVRPYFLVH